MTHLKTEAPSARKAYLVQSFAFKGCSWRLIPAYPPCPDCHNKGIFEIARSRNDMLKLAFYISMQLSLLSPLSDLLPSSDAVDDQFQRTVDDCHYNGIVEFESSRAFDWYAKLCMTLLDQDCVTHLKPRCRCIDSLYKNGHHQCKSVIIMPW